MSGSDTNSVVSISSYNAHTFWQSKALGDNLQQPAVSYITSRHPATVQRGNAAEMALFSWDNILKCVSDSLPCFLDLQNRFRSTVLGVQVIRHEIKLICFESWPFLGCLLASASFGMQTLTQEIQSCNSKKDLLLYGYNPAKETLHIFAECYTGLTLYG